MIHECWHLLVDRCSALYGGRILTAHYVPKDIPIDDLVEILSTVPMGNIFRIIFLNNLQTMDKKALSRLSNSLKRPAPFTCFVMGWHDPKGMAEVEQIVEKTGGIVILANAPRPSLLPSWVKKHVLAFGKKMSDEAASLLVQYAGNNLWVLHNEIEKLVLYAGDKEFIGEEDVLNATSCKEFYSIFEFVDYLSQGNFLAAVESLRALISSGEASLAILGLLSRHIRLLWQIKSAMKEKLPKGEISRITGLPDFVLDKMMAQSKNISENTLRELHKLLVHMDLKLKTTSLSPEYLFTHLIIRFFQSYNLQSSGQKTDKISRQGGEGSAL